MEIEDEDGWSYPNKPLYQSTMVEFMTFFHGRVEYAKDATFTRAELFEITPRDIKRWFGEKAYGDPDYKVELGHRPTKARHTSILWWKKALSFFMPQHGPSWCNGQGNPTKHKLIADFVKEVKKFKVRGEGAKSQAKLPINQEEF